MPAASHPSSHPSGDPPGNGDRAPAGDPASPGAGDPTSDPTGAPADRGAGGQADPVGGGMLRVAACQLNSTDDPARNRAVAEELIRRAAGHGAQLVVLPEKWNLLAAPEVMAAHAEPLDGPSVTWARKLAAELGVDLVAGSISETAAHPEDTPGDPGDTPGDNPGDNPEDPSNRPEGNPGSNPGSNQGDHAGGNGRARGYNTSVHIGPDGALRAVYRKIHLFDVQVGQTVYRESEHERPGASPVVSTLATGAVAGLAVCYDLRFPELFRVLALGGAQLVTLPSAFTVPTTRDHWEVLLRARAIENQVFVVAPNQTGGHPGPAGRTDRCGGRSMIIDPWGLVLAQAHDRETVIVADLDFGHQRQLRGRLPALAGRVPAAYAGLVP